MVTSTKQKDAERERIARDTAAFFDEGKMIEVLTTPVAPPDLRGRPVPNHRFNPGA